jgi:peptidoglycan L-alanyl-D-glutamate endopeptidase CwlK
MSSRLFPDDVVFLQRLLCSAGCYSGPRDGVWRDAVDVGEQQLEQIAAGLATQQGAFDPRTERNIRTLHPKAQLAARRFLAAARAAGIDARIISGTRTYAEQEALYRIGRFGDTRKKVTNAKAGASNHNFGYAWDIGIFENGKYLTTVTPYKRASAHCPAGVEWGGSWRTFPDPPHYQLAVGKSLEEVRTLFEGGRPFVNA